MSDVPDWLDTLFKLAVPAIWLLGKAILNRRNASQTATSAPAVASGPSTPSPRPAALPRQPAPQSDLRQRLQHLHGVLLERRNEVGRMARARKERGQGVRQALEGPVDRELRALSAQLDAFGSGSPSDDSGAIAGMVPHVRRLMQQLDILALAARLGETPSIDAVMADAERITNACLAPLQQFADAHEVPLTRTRALCLPADLAGGEATWIGLLGMGIPVIFVPDDFEADLMRWPSVAHELGHVILHGIPGLQEEMGDALGWNTHTQVLRVERGQLVGSPLQAWSAWREEIFADAFTVLMLGPAALDGFLAVFAKPEDPEAVLTATASQGHYNPHPPAHLRVHLASFLLEEVGFIEDGRNASRKWNALHGFPELQDLEDDNAPTLMLPLADGRFVHMDLTAAVERGKHGIRTWLQTQFRQLAGHSVLSLPGFDLGPGVWARTERMAERLHAGDSVRADGRVILAAAIHAGTLPGANARVIAKAVQRSVRESTEALSSRRLGSRTSALDRRSSAVLDALLLQEILSRPPGPTRRPPGQA